MASLEPIRKSTEKGKISKINPPWLTDIQFVKGVGEKIAGVLKKNEITTLWDLLFFLPREYEDRRQNHSWGEVVQASHQNKVVSGLVVVEKIVPHRAGKSGRKWTEVLCTWSNGTGESHHRDQKLVLLFFNSYGVPFEVQFPVGTQVRFRGKVHFARGRIQSTHPELQIATKDWPEYEKGIVPIYRELGGLPNRLIRRILFNIFERPEIKLIPQVKYTHVGGPEFESLERSLSEVHRPQNWNPIAGAAEPAGPFYKRIIFEELFLTSLSLLLRKRKWREGKTLELACKPAVIRPSIAQLLAWKNSLPYQLTSDQQKVLDEIFIDIGQLSEPVAMHRLVQGDVGSGKTIVAFLSCLAAVDSGFQAAMMAPTEILATQHYENFLKLFPKYSEQTCLLKGALKASEKERVRKKIESGEIKFVIGTQALIAEGTRFHSLGLVVIDEQHRFGVAQRWGLTTKVAKENKIQPHLLVMTATPIPRSLALTLYGDLNLSQIRSKPAGRIPIETHFVSEKIREALEKRLLKFLDENRQIYCVFPLIEESEDLDIRNAVDAFTRMTRIFPNYKIGLLHGKMKNKEKDQVMESFRNREIHVLVSTTVIEVGVDVPNASVIVIENCDRFGLSQLHQLRGRVGRGSSKSYCVLVGPESLSKFAKERVEIMCKTEDGFEISEKDLELRGPGEFLGQRQSGLPGFRVVHLLRDREILEQARLVAESLLKTDPDLLHPENQPIVHLLDVWWGVGRNPLSFQISG
jgi:ATP-dependent DNA helicase RecG